MMTPPLTPTIRQCPCGTEFVTLARTAKWCGRCRMAQKQSRMTDPKLATAISESSQDNTVPDRDVQDAKPAGMTTVVLVNLDLTAHKGI
jgi:hypothetical protein